MLILFLFPVGLDFERLERESAAAQPHNLDKFPWSHLHLSMWKHTVDWNWTCLQLFYKFPFCYWCVVIHENIKDIFIGQLIPTLVVAWLLHSTDDKTKTSGETSALESVLESPKYYTWTEWHLNTIRSEAMWSNQLYINKR
jgi:hypothetical protein